MAKAKQKIFVLVSEHNDYDQHGEYFVAAFAEMPSVQKLAAFFKGVSGLPTDVMAAVEFLEGLRSGESATAHQGQVHYTLKSVEVL